MKRRKRSGRRGGYWRGEREREKETEGMTEMNGGLSDE